jgi:hypothetical protein
MLYGVVKIMLYGVVKIKKGCKNESDFGSRFQDY